MPDLPLLKIFEKRKSFDRNSLEKLNKESLDLLNNFVCGELTYFALCPVIVLPPKPTNFADIEYIGNVIRSINLEYKPFVPVSIIPKSMASVKL